MFVVVGNTFVAVAVNGTVLYSGSCAIVTMEVGYTVEIVGLGYRLSVEKLGVDVVADEDVLEVVVLVD